MPALLSLDRHSTYLAACNGDEPRPVRLQAWSIEISAAFWGGFNLLEICLRNALHAQLTNVTGQSDWWNTPLRLSYEHRRKVVDALRFVTADKAEFATDGHVVAELTRAELLRNLGPWRSIDDLEIATAQYIDWFNHRRLHGEIGLVPPTELQDTYYRHNPAPTSVGASVPSLH